MPNGLNRYDPLDGFVTRKFSVYQRPKTPVVTLPGPKPAESVLIPKKRGPKPRFLEPEPLEFTAGSEGITWTREEIETSAAKLVNGCGRDVVDPSSIRMSDIIEMVAKVSGLSVAEIVGTNRQRRLVRARQVTMWLCRRFAGRSTTMIGQKIGGRDHTTVIHALLVIDKIVQSKISPTRDTPAGWVRPLLEAAGALNKEDPIAKDTAPLPAIGEFSMAAGHRRQRLADYDPVAKKHRMEGRGSLAGGDGSEGSGPTDRTVSPDDPGVPARQKAA